MLPDLPYARQHACEAADLETMREKHVQASGYKARVRQLFALMASCERASRRDMAKLLG